MWWAHALVGYGFLVVDWLVEWGNTFFFWMTLVFAFQLSIFSQVYFSVCLFFGVVPQLGPPAPQRTTCGVLYSSDKYVFACSLQRFLGETVRFPTDDPGLPCQDAIPHPQQ